MLNRYWKVRSSFASVITSDVHWQKVFQNVFDLIFNTSCVFLATALTQLTNNHPFALVLLDVIVLICSLGILVSLIYACINYSKAHAEFRKKMKEHDL